MLIGLFCSSAITKLPSSLLRAANLRGEAAPLFPPRTATSVPVRDAGEHIHDCLQDGLARSHPAES